MAKFLSSAATLTVVVDASRLRHTRRCNGRATCSCELRIQSAFFHKTLTDIVAQGKKRRAGERRPAAMEAQVTKRKYQRVSNIQQLSLELKVRIAAFLAPRVLGRLGMVNKKLRRDVDLMAKLMMEELLAGAPLHKLLKQERPTTTESWSQFMHKQMTCVHKIFVYYTGYKTGAMRQESPHWAFGVIDVDPNEPYCSILPNTWTFHGHTPWLLRRSNGSGGEWRLAKKYTPKKAPCDFLTHVKSWASTLRPGSLLAIAYKNAGCLEPAWWEAQAWYLWRGDGKQYPVTVFDPETEAHIHVRPDDLNEHFRTHPLHVIDVSTKPGAVCTRCASRNRTFVYCHVDRGHPML